MTSTHRILFVLAFVAACVAFRFGYRRIRRVRHPESMRGAFRLAFYLAMGLLVGCSGTRGGGATSPEADGTTAIAPASELGADFDAVWADLMALWREGGTFEPGVVTETQLDEARGRLDGFLARLAGIGAVSSDAPGLVAITRIEFLDRLEMMPADVMCYEPAMARSDGAESWERIRARVDAVEELATKGYVNDWVRTEVIVRLRADVDRVRRAMAQGDAWRTDDWMLREIDPAEVESVVARAEAALGTLEGR